MIGRSVSVSFSLTLPNISISLHKSWFMIHKREKWHGNSCKTTIYKWFEFCQNSETTNQNDSRDTKMARRFAILTNSKCSNFVKLSKRMHIRPHDNRLPRMYFVKFHWRPRIWPETLSINPITLKTPEKITIESMYP